ncbi:MAG TPA: phosphatase PAP2 family protein [Gaiellaceae bacterium]|nr:phosphatase PAP2 family protein [Gaiellaceae bacterium]
MTAAVAAGRRVLPRGYADFALQIVIWFGFLGAYQLARGVADRNPAEAFQNGLRVIDVEQRVNGLFELSLQGIVDSSRLLAVVTSWTYWLSQFTVLGLALLWVYLRHNEHFARFRNVVMLANVIGLAGYVLAPTAPPRMFPDFGFVDTLSRVASLNHGSGVIELASNPYAAMPSLHAADALIVGVALALIVRRRWAGALWLCWPVWVWFSVIATGNHFWLDIVAGVLVALAAGLLLERRLLFRRA